MAEVSNELKKLYSNNYTDIGAGWRRIGAVYKAQNVMKICASNGVKPRRILEYGAGTGDILREFSQHGFGDELYAVEISENSCKYIKSHSIPNLVDARVFDGYNTGFENKYFDLVVLSHVLEHVEFERLVLREIKRISDLSCIEVPLDYSHRIDQNFDHFASYGHINIYTAALIRFLLMSEKFKIIDNTVNITAIPVREYQHFKLSKVEPETAENLARKRAEWETAQAEYEALDQLQKELRAREITILASHA